MKPYIAFFEDGSIIETHAGRAYFKRQIIIARSFPLLNGKRPRVWFRPCDEWKRASDEELKRWKEISRM